MEPGKNRGLTRGLGVWYDGDMGKEWLRRGLWILKLSGYLTGTSVFMAAEVVLFFILQEAWKDWQAQKRVLAEVLWFTLAIALIHIPVLAGVLWFTRKAQSLWDASTKRQGG